MLALPSEPFLFRIPTLVASRIELGNEMSLRGTGAVTTKWRRGLQTYKLSKQISYQFGVIVIYAMLTGL